MEAEMRSIAQDIALCAQEIRRRRYVILLMTAVGMIVGVLLSCLVRNNVYSARAAIYNGQYASYYDSVAISNFLQDTQALAQSYSISEEAVRILGDGSYTAEMLRDAVQVEVESDSNIVWLTVEFNNPERAIEMVNAFTETLVGRMKSMAGVESVQVLEYAQIATIIYEVGEVRLLIALITALSAAMVSSVVFILKILFSSKIISIDRCTLNGEINLLGIIPEIKQKG